MKLKHLLIPLSVLVLAGCSQSSKTTETTTNTPKTEETTKSFVDTQKYVKDASFLLGKDAKPIAQDEALANNVTVIDWYVDPYCPACIKLETIMKEKTKEILSDGNTVIRFHPLGFLSAKSVGDYSNRAAAYILGAVEYAPDVAFSYMTAIMNDEFRPNNVEKTDDKFKEKFIEVGGTESQWESISHIHKKYVQMVKDETSKAFNNKELASKSQTGSLYVPYLIIGKSDKALYFPGDIDAGDYVVQKLNEYKESQQKTKDSEKSESTTEKAKEETTKEKSE